MQLRKPVRHLAIVYPLMLVVMLLPASSWAAGGPPMITDDPGTPGDGHWEINVAALSTQNAGSNTYQLPLVDANFGIGDRLQLKFEMPWLLQDDASGTRRTGIGNGLAGVKWRFYDGGDDAWQVSTYPQVELGFPMPNAASNELTNSGNSYLLPAEFERGFDGFDINFEVGRWFRPVPQVDSWIAGCALTYEPTKGLELIAELHQEVAVYVPRDELILNFGSRWNLSDQYTLLLSVGHDMHNTLDYTNTLLTYLGLQIRY